MPQYSTSPTPFNQAPPADYRSGLHSLLRMAKSLRPCIPAAEVAITLQFAGPYTPGGLLVLLKQPRSNHPWERGASAVIKDCDTLDMVNEGAIRFHGGDGLQGAVSLLDTRPFLPEEITNSLSQHDTEEIEEIEDFVMACIQAKNPACILCMGDVAASALQRTRDSSSHPFWRRVPIVYARHPSRSIHFQNEDLNMRTSLLDSIKHACAIATRPSQPPPLETPVESVQHHATLGCQDDLLHFMELLLYCCFERSVMLPERNINKGDSCFRLQRWQTKWFTHVCRQPDPVSLARARLIQLFRALNPAIRLSSWFEATYTFDRARIVAILAENMSSIEADCCLISTHKLQLPTPAETTQAFAVADQDGIGDIMPHVSRMAARNLKEWKERANRTRRGVSFYIGFADGE
ncbi:hypothetical protein K4F52_009473 [Lecanicillium sp. MT-2017a]|nr:hypothetical protein K4F52_009473 [Lecanicillium sp. MT-2017a]